MKTTTISSVVKQATVEQEKHDPLLHKAKLFYQPQDYSTHKINGLKENDGIVILNDIHIPFQDNDVLEAVETFMRDFKPAVEIYNGDIVDFYNASAYNANPSRVFTLQDELDGVRAWFARRVKANPTARRFYCFGNHEDRLRRWLWKDGTKLSALKCLQLDELMGLKEFGIHSISYGSRYDVLGFLVEHGHRAAKSGAFPANVARLMAIERGSSGVCGHDHRAQVYSWSDNRGSHCWINNACLCSLTPEYLASPNWQHGFTYATVHDKRIHSSLVSVHDKHGFVANGKYYRV